MLAVNPDIETVCVVLKSVSIAVELNVPISVPYSTVTLIVSFMSLIVIVVVVVDVVVVVVIDVPWTTLHKLLPETSDDFAYRNHARIVSAAPREGASGGRLSPTLGAAGSDAFYALDKVLDLPAGSTKEPLLAAMKGHILAQAELMGRYSRK